MISSDIVVHIKSMPIFKNLPSHNMEQLASIAIDQHFRRGEIVFSEGDKGTGFYVVVSGRVKIFKLSFEGKEQILHFFGPGEPFGEVAIFEGWRFPAHAQCVNNTRIFFFPRDAFVDLLKRHPTLSLNMLAMLSMRLRKFTHLVEDLSLKEVPGRLAAYLLYLRERNGGRSFFELDISKSQLASLLGTIPETVSRIFTKMNKQGIIHSDGRHIQILDAERLRCLSEEGERL